MNDYFSEPSPLLRLKRDEYKAKITFAVFTIIILILLTNIIWLNMQLTRQRTDPAHQAAATSISPVPTRVVPTVPITHVSVTPAITPQSVTVPQNAGKDFFVPLGTGSSQADDWEDIQGAVASIDLGQYTNVKQILFEASVNVPNANQVVYVRLFNKTDQHPVWYSEVSMNTQSAYLVSQPLTVDSGTKVYQVQMKTQLKSLASLTQSRIHIILK